MFIALQIAPSIIKHGSHLLPLSMSFRSQTQSSSDVAPILSVVRSVAQGTHAKEPTTDL